MGNIIEGCCAIGLVAFPKSFFGRVLAVGSLILAINTFVATIVGIVQFSNHVVLPFDNNFSSNQDINATNLAVNVPVSLLTPAYIASHALNKSSASMVLVQLSHNFHPDTLFFCDGFMPAEFTIAYPEFRFQMNGMSLTACCLVAGSLIGNFVLFWIFEGERDSEIPVSGSALGAISLFLAGVSLSTGFVYALVPNAFDNFGAGVLSVASSCRALNGAYSIFIAISVICFILLGLGVFGLCLLCIRHYNGDRTSGLASMSDRLVPLVGIAIVVVLGLGVIGVFIAVVVYDAKNLSVPYNDYVYKSWVVFICYNAILSVTVPILACMRSNRY